MRISCSQWRFSLSPIYERKTWKNLNIEIQNFISIFVFRYSPPWRFCAQICTIANVLIANIMFAVKVLTFIHLRKKNFEKFEYRNTEFYFDFRFSIFAPLAFLCSNLYYSECAHIEYHVRSGGSQFHPCTKEKFGKFEYRNTEFYFDFRFLYSPPWRFCAQICTIANVLIANIMFAVEVLTFTHLRKKNLEKIEYRYTEFYFDFRFSIFAALAFLCSNLYYSERAHCEYHVRIGGSHFHTSTIEKLGKF